MPTTALYIAAWVNAKYTYASAGDLAASVTRVATAVAFQSAMTAGSEAPGGANAVDDETVVRSFDADVAGPMPAAPTTSALTSPRITRQKPRTPIVGWRRHLAHGSCTTHVALPSLRQPGGRLERLVTADETAPDGFEFGIQ